MKKIICILMLSFFLTPCVFAEEAPSFEVPQDWQTIIDDAPLTANDFKELSLSQLLNYVTSSFLDVLKTPIRLLAKICGVLLLVATAKSFCLEKSNFGVASLLETVSALTVFSFCNAQMLGLMAVIQTTIETSQTYLAMFIPVFASVLATCGQAGSALLYNGIFLGVTNLITMLLCKIGFPATRVFLALTATAAVGSTLDLSTLAKSIAKWAKWLLTLCATVFCALLSLQSAFAQSADTLALKTGKFLISSGIPVVGRALSDAMGGVLATVKLLKGSVGFAAIAVLAAAFLPLILQCIAYQIVFAIGHLVSGAVGDHKSEKMLQGLSECTALYLSMVIFFSFVVIVATLIMILLGNGG